MAFQVPFCQVLVFLSTKELHVLEREKGQRIIGSPVGWLERECSQLRAYIHPKFHRLKPRKNKMGAVYIHIRPRAVCDSSGESLLFRLYVPEWKLKWTRWPETDCSSIEADGPHNTSLSTPRASSCRERFTLGRDFVQILSLIAINQSSSRDLVVGHITRSACS